MVINNMLEWVKNAGKEVQWAWHNSLSWRADAAQATTEEYRKALIQNAKEAYYG